MCHFVGIWLAGKLIAATGDGIFSNIRLWIFGSLIERTNRIWNILIFFKWNLIHVQIRTEKVKNTDARTGREAKSSIRRDNE